MLIVLTQIVLQELTRLGGFWVLSSANLSISNTPAVVLNGRDKESCSLGCLGWEMEEIKDTV